VSSRRRSYLARRAQALKHDLELLILRPASPPAGLYNFEPFDLSTALMTVHKLSSHHQSSLYKAALAGGRPIIDDGNSAGSRFAGRGGHIERAGVILAIDTRLYNHHPFEAKTRRQCIV
jgi:hypothetical protein